MKKCMNKFICFEKIILYLTFIILLMIGFCMYNEIKKRYNTNSSHPTIKLNTQQICNGGGINLDKEDVLLNPYTPPLNKSPYIISKNIRVPRSIPTNISYQDAEYRQIGILTVNKGKNQLDNKSQILALFGRPLFTSRNKWQYYTMTDKTNSIKLPIIFNGKSGTNEYGCDELFGGENVYVNGYNEKFNVIESRYQTIKTAKNGLHLHDQFWLHKGRNRPASTKILVQTNTFNALTPPDL